MASVIPGFEYDIFISYRQKDNKGERWVSEFVSALKTELGSAFKEEISVYFDVNPHDGLLETHDVKASLSEKLRSLIFIPVISRTYCDPKSFAWDHEFRAFIDLASHDQFGLKVKLPDNNVASRVLPVCIHDLDPDDLALCESVLMGPLRGIEFIYSSPGVNRPLRSMEEIPQANLNRTVYRDQINKLANAIRAIISGLKTASAEPGKDRNKPEEFAGEHKETKVKAVKGIFVAGVNKKLLAGIVIVILLLTTVSIIALPRFFRKGKLEKLMTPDGRISVAVIPFQNMTNDSTWNIWQDGIQFNVVSSLSNSQSLKVMQTESTNQLIRSKGLTNYSMITPSVARTITQNLDANVFVYGNINEAGDKIRISAQLINTKTAEIFKSFKVDGAGSRILQISDSLSSLIRNYLIISSLKNEISSEMRNELPSSVEAYKAYILGNKAFINYDYPSAARWFLQAVNLDSAFALSYVWLSISFANEGKYDQAEIWARKVYRKREQLALEQQILVNWVCAKYIDKSDLEEIKYAKQLEELNDRAPLTHWMVGLPYYQMHQYDNAIPEFEETLRIYKSWNVKPMNGSFYEALISSYHETGKRREEKELLKVALDDFPRDLSIIRRQIIYSLSMQDTVTADQYIRKAITLSKELSRSDAEIATGLAGIYSEAGIPDKAEKYYREAVTLEPENTDVLNDLALFLIDRNLKLSEGLELNKKAIKLSSHKIWSLQETRGWGLYKSGRDREALAILQECWDNRPRYDHDLYLRLEEVKKAVPGTK